MALSRCYVVKLGGEIARSPELEVLARDLVELRRQGFGVIVVHGGGPQVTELQSKLGQKPNIVAGRRITDAATLEVLKMAVAGVVNVDLCAALVRAGGAPVGLHGASALTVRARKRPPTVVAGAGDAPVDFGLVGDVVGVNERLLETLAAGSFIPVIASLGADEAGGVYNINADTVASQVARELSAEALVLVTEVGGVLADRNDSASRIARLERAAAERAISEGRVAGGMIPKVTEGFAALDRGVRAVLIVGKLQSGDLVRAITEPGSVGTLLVSAQAGPKARAE